MENCWTEQDLKECLSKIKQLREDVKNNEDYETISSVIAALKRNISEMEYSKKRIKTRFSDKLLNGYQTHESFVLEYQDMSLLASEIDSLTQFLKIKDLPVVCPKYPKIDVSCDKYLEYINGFYKTLDEELYSYFLEVYKNRDSHFKFNPKLVGAEGICVFFPILNENFIDVKPFDLFTNLSNGVHEFGHGVANLMNTSSCFSPTDYVFTEVEGVFPQLVANDYFASIMTDNKEAIYVSEYERLYSYVMIASHTIIKRALCRFWAENKMPNRLSLFMRFAKEKDINPSLAYSSFLADYDIPYTCVISYLASIELYDLYRKDREKALWIYKKLIREARTMHYRDLIKEDIELGEHVQDFALETMIKAKIIDPNNIKV